MAFVFNPFTGNLDVVNSSEDVFNISNQNANFTAQENSTNIVDTTNTITITLPTLIDKNTYVIVKDGESNANTNNITVITSDSTTIDGQAINIIDSDLESRTYIFDGSNWFVV